ncbi:cation transporter [Salinarchaeum sp. Harcht-Bsk1]|uniref:TrkH family potassium uptake protein n=1 Tax=Salinarchaeum sp. Harcht-Bsk1 TaxID=1333523 RepID=UPI0003423073|nr:TrkH family potassium uptake protein [Salinarchaeum sp. Harcht-Bsk1]AGN02482.1 cation transporter [Salinarchaeum sp. Harcht-Bsk1]
MRESLATIGRDLGRILQVLSVLVAGTAPIAVIWREFYVLPAVAASCLLPLAVGTGLARTFADANDPGKRHAMVIAAAGWFLVALLGALPFYLIAWTVALDPPMLAAPAGSETLAAFRNPLNALFESMSGFTGTGLTMTQREPALPATLQWWRSTTEWIGGVGVIVLTTAVLARPGSGSLTLYESEARSRKIHPSVVSTVRTIWWIFLLFTVSAIVLLWTAGMPLWEAINHGMTGISTGGFSVTDASIGSYDSAVIDLTLVPIMIAGSIAFPIHYLMFQGELRNVYRDPQTRWLLGLYAAGTIFLTALLLDGGPYDGLRETARFGLFQFVSALSCTGFQTAGSLGTEWSPASQLTVAGAMTIGGAAGSTVGGIKIIRLIMLVQGTRHRIAGIWIPSTAVRRLSIGDRRLRETETAREIEEAAIVSFLWVVFLGIGIYVLLLTVDGGQFTLENVVFEVASAQGNVGLSSGITGPGMPTPAKLVFLLNMWIGRLEIIPVLVFLRGMFSWGGLYE